MSDALQIAKQRLGEYRMAISKKENEIVELKEMVEDLDNFIEFGQALVGKDEEPKDEKVRQVVVSRPSPQGLTNSTDAPANDEEDDDWNTDAEEAKPSVARVVSQRVG